MIDFAPLRHGTRATFAAVAVVAVILPIMVTGLMLWSFLGRSDALDAVPVAIVNDDQPVTVGSGDSASTIAAGRQLAAGLTDPQTPGPYTLQWVLTDAQDAADGLAAGAYHAVLTIPGSFSADVTSTSTEAPVQARISVQSNDSADGLTGVISEQVVAAAADSLGDQASASYLDNLFVGFNTISQQMSSAAVSSSDLSSGATELASSTVSVDDGAQTLSDSLVTLENGAASVADGAATLTAAAADLASGATQTADGAAGVATASGDLAGGSADAADAGRLLAGSATALSYSATAISDACPHSAGVAYCARVRELAARAGAHEAGASGLADVQQDLAGGAAQLAVATTDVSAAAATVSAGAGELAGSAGSLEAGAADVSGGAQSAVSGAADLSDGTAQLTDGAESVASGSQSLASSLASGAASVPTYSDSQRETLQSVVTEPIGVASQRTQSGAIQAWPAALVAATVLWLGAIAATYLRRRPLPSDVAIPASSAVRSAFSTLSIVAAASVVQALMVWVTLLWFGVPVAVGGVALTLVGGMTFTAIMIALRTVWRQQGVLAGILLFAAQLLFSGGVLPIQTAPAFFQVLNPVLPFTAYANALAGTVSGTTTAGSVLASVAVLLCWAAVAVVVVVVVERGRAQGAAVRSTRSPASALIARRRTLGPA